MRLGWPGGETAMQTRRKKQTTQEEHTSPISKHMHGPDGFKRLDCEGPAVAGGATTKSDRLRLQLLLELRCGL